MSNQISLSRRYISLRNKFSASNNNVFFLHHLPDGYGNIARAYVAYVSNDVCDLKGINNLREKEK